MEIEKNTKHFSFGAGTGVVAGISDFAGRTVAKSNTIKITVDTSSMNLKTAYKGLGCVSRSGYSKLLLDYKVTYPEIYYEILNLLFKKGYGAELSHIKIELADVTGNYEFIFLADALKVNPELTTDMIRCKDIESVRKEFLISKKNGYRARYKWYINTIESAYKKYGIQFTHISPDECGTEKPDIEWIIYFSKRLKSEKNKLYDYSKIKIVSEGIADEMLKNEALRNAVDIIGLSHTYSGTENTSLLIRNYKKEIWCSEGDAPCNTSKFSVNCAGITDIAKKIINSYLKGEMTMYEFMPAVAGYYGDSSEYSGNLITANCPWSEYYSINSGFFMAMHFTRFTEKNWRFIDSACYGDDSDNYVTLMPEDKSELTMIFCNDTSTTKGYMIDISDCNMDDKLFGLIETSGSIINEHYTENWFRLKELKEPSKSRIYLEIKPYSLVTLTTVNSSFVNGINTVKKPSIKRKNLKLPYSDTFAYIPGVCDKKGNTPLFTNDLGGCFEIVDNTLQQMITTDYISKEPMTLLGDDNWTNYSAEIEFMLEDYSPENYAGIGIHYNSPAFEDSAKGCSVKIYGDGKVKIYFMNEVVSEFNTDRLKKDKWNKIKILSLSNLYMIYFNEKFIGDFTEKNAMQPAGRVALLSGFYKNKFRNIEVKPIKGTVKYVQRIDSLSAQIRYSKNVIKSAESSYKYSNCTSAALVENSSFSLNYSGYGFALCGTVENAEINIIFDGKRINNKFIFGGSSYRQAFYKMSSTEKGIHSLEISVNKGKIILDSILIFNNSDSTDKIKSDEGKFKENVKTAAAATAIGVSAALILKKIIKRKK